MFSIIIPAHSAENTLTKAPDSILEQKMPEWEAIMVDDGSTDQTLAIAAGFSERDGRIRTISQSQTGEGAARNRAIGKACFDWLLFLDADDWIVPSYLERMGDAVAAHPEVDAVHCGWEMSIRRAEFLASTDATMPAIRFQYSHTATFFRSMPASYGVL